MVDIGACVPHLRIRAWSWTVCLRACSSGQAASGSGPSSVAPISMASTPVSGIDPIAVDACTATNTAGLNSARDTTLGTSNPYIVELTFMGSGGAAGPIESHWTVAQATIQGRLRQPLSLDAGRERDPAKRGRESARDERLRPGRVRGAHPDASAHLSTSLAGDVACSTFLEPRRQHRRALIPQSTTARSSRRLGQHERRHPSTASQ
jgi:hypothetical protein